jgi:uncharacterized protein YjbI with pentapeptide repeats
MISKIELINRLQSPENRFALQAVEELRSCGKLLDGSLRGIALCQAQLDYANLKDTDLCFVDLHQAKLENVDLSSAKLRAAKLNRASLQGANLDGTDLTGADLYKVNLRSAQNLTDEQLATANELFGSIMPDGNVYDGRFNLAGDLARAKWAKVKVEDPKSMADFYGVSLDTYLHGQKKLDVVIS